LSHLYNSSQRHRAYQVTSIAHLLFGKETTTPADSADSASMLALSAGQRSRRPEPREHAAADRFNILTFGYTQTQLFCRIFLGLFSLSAN